MFKLDKEKYIGILRNEGVNAALTQLHRDQERFEYDTFEAPEGYERAKWERLHELRDFSRELWEIALRQPTSGQTS